MRELPQGWVEAKFGELLELKYGKALPDKVRDGRGFPVFGSNGVVGSHSVPLTNSETLVVGRKGSVGEVQYSAGPCSPIDTTYYVDYLWGMPFRYWLHFLRHLRLQGLNKATAIPGLSRVDAYRLSIPLAPLNEQKRIADKLDSLLARVDACRDRLDRVAQILKRFRQAVLAAATSGALTENWAGGGNWSTSQLGKLLTDVRYGTAKKSAYDIKEGTPVIRIPNIINGRVDTTDLKYGHFDKKELETLSLKKGDLLIIRSNGSLDLVGKAAVVGPEVQGYVFAGYIIRLRVKTNLIDPRYLYFCLTSPDIRQHIELTARSTSGVNNINSEEIRSIEVKLPEIDEQLEIIRRVESLFAYADRLEARYTVARAQVDQLTPSLLYKAFRGELVPHDPNDEPAEKLLERISMARLVPADKTKQLRKKKHVQKTEVIVIEPSQIHADHLSSILKRNGRQTAKALWLASQLGIEDFYEQLRTEEARGLLREVKESAESYLEAA